MKKLIALFTAALVAALVFAACGPKEPVSNSEGEITELTTTVPETEPTTSIDQLTGAAEGSTTSPEPSTAETAAAPALPQGKKDILAAYTKVVNKVKADAPEFKSNDWQTMSNIDIGGVIYRMVSGIAGGFLETKEESTVGTHTKGSHPKWFAMPTNSLKEGCVLTDTSKITAASAKQSGDAYIIKITLEKEKDPVRDLENPRSVSSWHGRLFDVIDITEVTEYAKNIPGFNAGNTYCTFVGTATLKYDPVTDQCISLDHSIDVRIFLNDKSAKVIADYTFYDFKW